MTPDEAVEVLTRAAAYDQRTIGRADAQAWSAALPDIDPERAIAAVAAWYGEHSDRRIMPADIRHALRGSETDRHPAYRQLKDAVAEAEKAAGGTELPALPAAGTPRLGPEQARAALAAALDRVAKTMKIPDAAPTGYTPKRQRPGQHAAARRQPTPMLGRNLTICHGCAGDIPAPQGWDASNPYAEPLYCGPCAVKAATARGESA